MTTTREAKPGSRRTTFVMVMDFSLGYLGGAQVAFLNQARALVDAGHRVIVVAPDASTSTDLSGQANGQFIAIDIPVWFTIPGAKMPVIRNSPRVRARMRDILIRFDADAVLTHSEFGLAAAAVDVADALGIPSLHTVHTFFWQAPPLGPVAAWVAGAAHRAIVGTAPGRATRRAASVRSRLAPRALDSKLRELTLLQVRRADIAISPSAHQAHALEHAGADNVRVLSNTSAASAEEGEPKRRAPRARMRILWAARFAPEKRIQVALEAIEIVTRTHPETSLELVVAGGSVDDLPHNIRPLAGHPAVTVIGRVSGAEISRQLRESDAALITSLGFDNQPMIAVEAFRAARPVIVSDPVLATEFGDAAILSSSPSAEGLATTIVSLSSDPDALSRASSAAASASVGFGYAAHVQRLLALVDEARTLGRADSGASGTRE